jgi:hypothetical protein
MSLNYSYDYFANKQGEAHFYYAQRKTNRMRDWKYLYDSPSYEKVLQEVKDAQERVDKLLASGDKAYARLYKTMKFRIIKVDAELLPI